MSKNSFEIKVGLAEMLKGGVIMDVTNVDQAKIAEDSGACAVMALERIPSDIRKDGGIARMSDPEMILGIQSAVSIPVMAKCRIGHFAEAQVLETLEVDFIDESEVLTPADEHNHVWKHDFKIPFVCGCRNLGEALRRIAEGAAMIRTKGEAGSGNIVEAVRHMRTVMTDIKRVTRLDKEEIVAEAKNIGAPVSVLQQVAKIGKLPVPNFAAGGIATPADASLMMQLGAETGAPIFFASATISSLSNLVTRLMSVITVLICRTASTIFPLPASPFVLIIAAPSAILRRASPKFLHPLTKGILKSCFQT
jgi:pyridoxal 5'-phosphate synthase pdxS subunit